MVRLAAELLDADLRILAPGAPRLSRRISALITRSRQGKHDCLLIGVSPTDLECLLALDDWRRKFRKVIAWIFDSFWVDSIPRYARVTHHFDHVFVTEREDLRTWRRRMRAPVSWLPWGSDVLRLGSPNGNRTFDLLRIGRQPSAWDDDKVTERACRERNLSFHGRPESSPDASENEKLVMRIFSQSKFSLTFSNAVSPSIQTHPTREYITARWVDALAAGATVAGIPPRSESVTSLLWPEALLDIGTTEIQGGLDVIQDAIRRWSPQHAQFNYLRALDRLDWRWRFQTIAEALGCKPSPLQAELAALQDKSKRHGYP